MIKHLMELGDEVPLMVIDVESIGLHGDGYAVGYVVIAGGKELESGTFACPGGSAEGAASDRLWVYENVPGILSNCPYPAGVRERFWKQWIVWKERGAMLAADCGWPVEARFLAACVDDDPEERRFAGPYPLIEISTTLLCAGMDPMAKYPRRENELPEHDPLADARQSARLLMEALSVLSRIGVT